MWPRLESRGKGKGGMCVCVCVCFAFQAANCGRCRMQLHFKWLFWCKKANIWRKGCHMKYFHEVNCSINRSSCLAQNALWSEEERTTLYYGPWGGDTNHISLQSVWRHHYDAWHPVLWYNKTVPVYINVWEMDWDIWWALNCTIVVLQHTAGPVALDIKCLMGSWGSPQWRLRSISVLGPETAYWLHGHCMAAWSLHGCMVTAWSPDLRGTPVGKWLLLWWWARWDHPLGYTNKLNWIESSHTHSYEESRETHTHRHKLTRTGLSRACGQETAT